MLDIPAYVMWRASDDVLKQRRVVKATKLSHKSSPPPKADESVIQQRKIIKVKRRSSTCSSSTDKPSTTSSNSTPSSPQRDDTSTPHVSGPSPPPVPKSSANTSPTPQTSDTDDTDEVLLLKMRATLFTRVDRTWAKKAKGTLHVYKAKSNEIRWIELKNNDNECILNLLVEQMINLHKLVKESTKGVCAYIKYSVEKRKGTESLLLQVMPGMLDPLYSTLICEVDK